MAWHKLSACCPTLFSGGSRGGSQEARETPPSAVYAYIILCMILDLIEPQHFDCRSLTSVFEWFLVDYLPSSLRTAGLIENGRGQHRVNIGLQNLRTRKVRVYFKKNPHLQILNPPLLQTLDIFLSMAAFRYTLFQQRENSAMVCLLLLEHP